MSNKTMTQETITIAHEIWDGLKYLVTILFAAVAGLFGWHLKNANDRIAQLDGEKVDKEHFDASISSVQDNINNLRDEINTYHSENRDDHNRIHGRIDELHKPE